MDKIAVQMKVNDIDYDYFQSLLKIKEAFESELHNKAKFIKYNEYNQNVYIRADEAALLAEFKNMADTKEFWGSAIQAYCHEKNIQFSEFVTKYGMKK